MHKNDSRECILKGYAILTAKEFIMTNYEVPVIVRTLVRVPATYTSDWQYDGGFWHDEGGYDYDLDKYELVYPREYEYLDTTGEWKEGKHRLVTDRDDKVYQANLEEV